MGLPVRAIDLLCYPPAQQASGVLLGALPCFDPSPALLQHMDRAGVEKVFVTQCKKWSCERQWVCVDTRLEDVLRYTQAFPERFIGQAGYNPYNMVDSLEEIELAVRRHGFRGVYVHAASFRLPLTDAHMYPLFAKAVELGVPVLVQLGQAGTPEGRFNLGELERVAADFDDLVLLGAIAEWPERQELEWICSNLENLYFVIDANVLATTPPWVRGFLASPCGRDRCCWGSYGVAWETALQQFHQLGLPEEVERRLLRDNATRLFRLDREFKVLPRARPVPDPLLAER